MNKLILQLRGGLGNQLFQATALNFFSNKFSTIGFLDDVSIIYHNDLSRRSWIRNLNLESMFSESKIRFTNLSLTKIRRKLPRRERHFSFIGELELNDLISLHTTEIIMGWFQTNRYLPKEGISFENSILHGLSQRVVNYNLTHVGEEVGAVHIRLGDFKQTSWGTLPYSWYRKSISCLVDQGIKIIDCFSDDINEARQILSVFNGLVEIRYPEEKSRANPIELLWLLTGYKYFVSSNSSLSWWASYLNRSEAPQIICGWGDELLMPGWIKI
jgi:hypothetical protein